MALNDWAAAPPEMWVNPCYWLSTWKETYSHKIQPIFGTKYLEKSTCPTTLFPPKHHVQVGRPRQKRKRSKHEDEPFMKDGKLSRKGRTITCQSCGNTGHNKTTCKGQGQKASTGGNNAEASGLFVAAGEGGAGGVGVASQGSSHSRWTKRRVQTERISPQKRTPTQPASQPSTSSQVPVSETKNADKRKMSDGVPTQSSAAGGASEWSFLMDDPNITMEEYIRLEEEKAQKRGKVFNWETSKYGKIWYDEDILDLRSVKTEFPAIVFNDNLTSNEIPSCEPTVSSPNDEIDFRISFDESDDEDYTPSVSCIDDLDFFKDFENEFPAIVYNDALTSKSDFSTEPTLCPQHIDKFDLKDETSLSEYDEVEQSVLYFNDLFPFNIVYPDDLKSDKGNDDNKIDMIQSSEGNENTNKLLEESHDKIKNVFIMGSFIMGLNVNIVAWNYFFNEMIFNLIKNLYVSFGIPFDPKRYYKDGDYARMLRRLRYVFFTLLNLGKIGLQEWIRRIRTWLFHLEIRGTSISDLRDCNLIAEGLSTRILMEHRDAQGQSVFTSRAWRRLFDIKGPLVHELILEFFSTFRFGEAVLDLDTARALQFQLGGARRYPSWRQFILALGLHTTEEMETISSAGDFLGTTPSYTSIRDPILRLCHRDGCWIGQHPLLVGLISEKVCCWDEERGSYLRWTICAEFKDTWAWVPAGPARTQGERIARLVEEVHGMREALQGERGPVIKPGSKFSTIVREYVTEASRLSKSRAELRRESVYKSVKAEEKA
ncbi:hypothetical protein Tco_0841501 [Tanacetum coccineum]|uniref:CCHC-type domain-containing protein n=1 Tax=Tanacetum coccineum TaxID=301880 RepID=A0ABQ5AYC4_9ASTR